MKSFFKNCPLVAVLAIIVSCDSEPKKKASEHVIVPLCSSEQREFDEHLAAIHEKWLGTEWTFSGTSKTPKKGSIACGYFVTTTLEQAGVSLDRIRLAQAASEKMIIELVKPEAVKRYSDTKLDDFLTSIRKQGEGYYIVGLDNHTGFLRVRKNGTITFVHSGPGRGVVVEAPQNAPELATSRYRVTGKLAIPPNFSL